MSLITDLSPEELSELVKQSFTFAEVLRALGYKQKGGRPWVNLKNRLKELNIDTSHFKGRGHGTSSTARYTLEEIMVENSWYTNTTTLKNRIVKEGLLEYKCSICGLTEWQGIPIVLQLDHINGMNMDHRIHNIRFLCPNCHSQTDNFCSKNR